MQRYHPNSEGEVCKQCQFKEQVEVGTDSLTETDSQKVVDMHHRKSF